MSRCSMFAKKVNTFPSMLKVPKILHWIILTITLPPFQKRNYLYLHCAGGYRSVIAASILKSRGIHNLIDIAGGFKSIQETQIPKTDYVCPST